MITLKDSIEIKATPDLGKIRFPLWLFKKMHKKHEGNLEASEQNMKEEEESLKRALEKMNG